VKWRAACRVRPCVVLVGSVIQSDQGMATSYQDAQALICGAGEAVRHYKDGSHAQMRPGRKSGGLQPSAPICAKYTVPGDMFFTYVTKVCLEQHQDLVVARARESAAEAASRAQSFARSPGPVRADCI